MERGGTAVTILTHNAKMDSLHHENMDIRNGHVPRASPVEQSKSHAVPRDDGIGSRCLPRSTARAPKISSSEDAR